MAALPFHGNLKSGCNSATLGTVHFAQLNGTFLALKQKRQAYVQNETQVAHNYTHVSANSHKNNPRQNVSL